MGLWSHLFPSLRHEDALAIWRDEPPERLMHAAQAAFAGTLRHGYDHGLSSMSHDASEPERALPTPQQIAAVPEMQVRRSVSQDCCT